MEHESISLNDWSVNVVPLPGEVNLAANVIAGINASAVSKSFFILIGFMLDLFCIRHCEREVLSFSLSFGFILFAKIAYYYHFANILIVNLLKMLCCAKKKQPCNSQGCLISSVELIT
jgi:hypothetical protein